MRREVFYISGYDPRSAKYYYALLKKNAFSYEQIRPSKLQQNDKNHAFCIFKKENLHCTYHFLSWNDIVKIYWLKGLFKAVLDCLYFFFAYALNGLFLEYAKSCKATLIAGFYPFFYFLFSFFISFALAYFIFDFLSLHSHLLVACALCLVWLGFSFVMIYKFANKTAAFWLLRICTFCARVARGKIPEFEKKMEIFAVIILKNLQENHTKKDYELVIVAHSVGTILLVGLCQRLIILAKERDLSLKSVKILSLGECIPLASYHKEANDFRKALSELGANTELTWFDYTSKIDGACFYKLDVFQSSKDLALRKKYEVSNDEIVLKRQFLSTHFYKVYSPQEYEKIRKDWYKTHFLYLFANEFKNRGVYDFFALILGTKPLEILVKE